MRNTQTAWREMVAGQRAMQFVFGLFGIKHRSEEISVRRSAAAKRVMIFGAQPTVMWKVCTYVAILRTYL